MTYSQWERKIQAMNHNITIIISSSILFFIFFFTLSLHTDHMYRRLLAGSHPVSCENSDLMYDLVLFIYHFSRAFGCETQFVDQTELSAILPIVKSRSV